MFPASSPAYEMCKDETTGLLEEGREEGELSKVSSNPSNRPQKAIEAARQNPIIVASVIIHFFLALASVGSLATILEVSSSRCLHGPDLIYSKFEKRAQG